MNNKTKEIIVILIVPLVFWFFGVMTLKDYGVNWDEPFHFMRGQAYLHFFLTGETDYRSLPPYPRLNKNCFDGALDLCLTSPAGPTDRQDWWGGNLIYEKAIEDLYPDNMAVWRGYYQHDDYPFHYFIKNEDGHPAIGDTLAATFNYLFYQRLHIFGDIDSYHLFEVFASFLLVMGIAIIVYIEYGVFPAVVASFTLAAYPLFFSESHFNIKDPPETAFYGLTIIFFYLGLTRNIWKYIIISAFMMALAVGTKFNALFIIPTLGLWTVFHTFFLVLRKRKSLKPVKFNQIALILLALIIHPILAAVLFYLMWPYLWGDPVNNFLNILKYYQQIGAGTPFEMAKYLIHGWNTYPVIWILYTTPIPMLVLSLVGFVTSVFLIAVKKNTFAFLVLVWFLIPILRSSVLNASIYGGVRQIMEFLPAMAILAGIGAFYIIRACKITNRPVFTLIITITILVSLAFTGWEVIKIHPNENVYFNQMIGGLSGAKQNSITYWGNSYGNAYQQGLDWLNKNAEPNARLGLPISTMGNIPWIKLRSDIDFSNAYWSGPARRGEYEIELDFDWAPTNWYSFAYYNTYLNPVFVAQVDGVPLLKVWKNDLQYTKKGFESERVYPVSLLKSDKSTLKIDMGKEIDLTRITIKHSNTGCAKQKGGYVSISRDAKVWVREPEPIDYPQVPPSAFDISDKNFVFLFAAKRARYILLETGLDNPCLLKNFNVEVRGLSG